MVQLYRVSSQNRLSRLVYIWNYTIIYQKIRKVNMIACVYCGGLEPALAFLGLTCIPFIVSIYHKVKHKCCKNSCVCECHDDKKE